MNLTPCFMSECSMDTKATNSSPENCNMMYCNNNASACVFADCWKNSRHFSATSQSRQFVTKECEVNNTNETTEDHFALLGQFGGYWKPNQCLPIRHVAIIIPYRDRREHLCILLKNLIPVLVSQLTEFRIFVIEQVKYWLDAIYISNIELLLKILIIINVIITVNIDSSLQKCIFSG